MHEPLPPVSLGISRAGCVRFQPRRFSEFRPTDHKIPSVLPPRPPTPPPPASPVPMPDVDLPPPLPDPSPPKTPDPVYVITEPDQFGLYRVYSTYPSEKPDQESSPESVHDSDLTFSHAEDTAEGAAKDTLAPFGLTDPDSESIYAPFSNASSFCLMDWFYSPKQTNSGVGLETLGMDVFNADGCNMEDLKAFRPQKELDLMDEYCSPKSNLRAADGWIDGSVNIRLPGPNSSFKSVEDEAPEFTVTNVFYRKPLEPKSTESSPLPPERIISELYNSDALIEEYEKIQINEYHDPQPKPKPVDPNTPTIENAIVALLWWSNSTHLASFGDASLWPLYLFFGNQSKYDHAKPTTFSTDYMAYIPFLPDEIQEHYQKIFGTPADATTLMHLKRELMYTIWALLDEEFIKAYKNGILVECIDSIIRQIFPRFFMYSADYPEKVLLATLKSLGQCPCPQCMVEKDQIPQLGTVRDRQQREHKLQEDTKERQGHIKKNIFSECLSSFGFDFYRMFVPDILHEVELGIWKAILTHLLCILVVCSGDTIQQLNSHYCQVPSFGQDTIQKFLRNVSAMKQLAAWDFEDLLQCFMPVFDGLVPEYNNIVLDLLWDLSVWQAYAKLRLHTTTSLDDMDNATTVLGHTLRKFKNTACSAFVTKDVPKETAACGQQTVNQVKKSGASAGPKSGNKRKRGDRGFRAFKAKFFNMCTFKIHTLGHYVCQIWRFGTTDDYTTQVGELEHRQVKRFYVRTNKSNFVRQVAKHERRQSLLLRVRNRVKKFFQKTQAPVVAPVPKAADQTPATRTTISENRKDWVDIFKWTRQHEDNGDPAVENFIPNLKQHVLGKVLNRRDQEFSDEECAKVTIVSNRLYRHKTLDIDYTSYDMRQCHDSINVCTHADVMVLGNDSHPDPHPYWYTRIIGIFHVDVNYRKQTFSFPFLWVRWFGLDPQPSAKCLPLVGFVDGPGVFGFLDPSYVLRAAHLIPAFVYGRSDGILGPSIARQPVERDLDWVRFYVGIFVDRDMFTRYFPGIAVGHHHILAPKHEDPQESSSDEEGAGVDSEDAPIVPANINIANVEAGNVEESERDSELDD
ncbi:hypothetical protein V5O48_009275 [Marasmius crinis-equi]|uniref:Uncharacterized protein n=1 Tax=Marasmius crinis-equi TaxID=585013 RepID=A0ABR3FBX4_9AGAR